MWCTNTYQIYLGCAHLFSVHSTKWVTLHFFCTECIRCCALWHKVHRALSVQFYSDVNFHSHHPIKINFTHYKVTNFNNENCFVIYYRKCISIHSNSIMTMSWVFQRIENKKKIGLERHYSEKKERRRKKKRGGNPDLLFTFRYLVFRRIGGRKLEHFPHTVLQRIIEK